MSFANTILYDAAEGRFSRNHAADRSRFYQDPAGFFDSGVHVTTKIPLVLSLVKRLWTLRDPDAHEHLSQLLLVRSLGRRGANADAGHVFKLTYYGFVQMPEGNGQSPSPPVLLTEEELDEIWSNVLKDSAYAIERGSR